MSNIDFATFAGLAITAFLVVFSAVSAGLALIQAVSKRAKSAPSEPDEEPAVFLFDEKNLIDISHRGQALLQASGGNPDPWSALISNLKLGFEDIEQKMLSLPNGERLDEWSADCDVNPLRLTASRKNGILNITIYDASDSESSLRVTPQSLIALEKDSELLRSFSLEAPIPVWKSDPKSGKVTWANKRYLDIAQEIRPGKTLLWPPPSIFQRARGETGTSQRRASIIQPQNDTTAWFELKSSLQGREIMNFAIPCDATVKAEATLKEFTQTLAKTFAHLPIGLSIFDHQRQLVLFNPALTDLSTLPVEFLLRKPLLNDFLDELRNRKMMPEPKDYKSWRETLATLEFQATKGTFLEKWSLPGGLTYRVTGRPHPQGALVLLFEDVSDEVTLARRFKSDLDFSQSVLDSAKEAIVAFSNSGIILQSNQAFTTMWGIDSRTALGEISVADAAKIWGKSCSNSELVDELETYIAFTGDRQAWTGRLQMRDGRQVICRVDPLPAGGTFVGFSELNERNDPVILTPNTLTSV